MDISDTLAPKSDQLDAVDLLGQPPRIFTITKVTRGNSEQPVNVHLAEFPRVWRPGKTMRRVMAHLWGTDSSQWPGRRVELFCDTEVVFGGEKVGGTRISRMSHIDGPKTVPVIIKKGRSGGYKVDPLPDEPTPTPTPPEPTAEEVAACTSVDDLRAMWSAAGPERQAQIKARVEELQATDTAVPDDAPGQLFPEGGEGA